MSSGQTLMALGAMVLLGKLALSTNWHVADTEVMEMQSEAVMSATTLGQSLIERLIVRGYDHNFPGGDDTVTVGSFVAPYQLGRDVGEIAGRDTMFNDLDDFNGYQDSVDTPRFGKFYLTTSVYYVRDAAPYDSVGFRSFLKRIDVRVTNKFMVDPNDPLKLSGPLMVSRFIAYD